MKNKLLLFILFLLPFSNNLGAAEYTVFVTPTGFESNGGSNQITINQGDTVSWFFERAGFTVTSGVGCNADSTFDSGTMDSGSTFSYRFDSAGTFAYFSRAQCTNGMVGQVTVTRNTASVNDKPSGYLFGSFTAYPNPMRTVGTLTYELKKPARVNIQIVDVTGKIVADIMPINTTGINRTDINVDELPGGLYIARLIVDGILTENKMLVKQR